MRERTRRVGIAVGSLVAAWLIVGLGAGMILPLFGVRPTETPDLTLTWSGAIMTLVTIVLGALIFRDIVGRERTR